MDSAVAAILAGSVVTWGDPDCGGDSSIQEQLRRFQEFFFFERFLLAQVVGPS